MFLMLHSLRALSSKNEELKSQVYPNRQSLLLNRLMQVEKNVIKPVNRNIVLTKDYGMDRDYLFTKDTDYYYIDDYVAKMPNEYIIGDYDKVEPMILPMVTQPRKRTSPIEDFPRPMPF